jgi:L-lysine exporter family protein LysE/ArgO
MFSAFLTGFFLGLSLIIAIGAQNAFVLRQGILRQHVFYIALFCAISDSILISIGITGISYFLNDLINEISNLIYGFSALWLFFYGVLRVRAALRSDIAIIGNNSETTSLKNAIVVLAAFTFLNPHVYLDTMILIGSISQQFIEINRFLFGFGACLASFVWFFSIAYGAKFFTPVMQKSSQWRILDILIALIMFIIAFKLASQSNWFYFF